MVWFKGMKYNQFVYADKTLAFYNRIIGIKSVTY